MKKSISLLSASSLMVIASMSLSAPTALAQGTPAAKDEVTFDEIFVTARGRKETLIEVPLSETLYTAADIEDARIQTVDDFIGLTPGITIANSQDSGTNFITIRGVSQVRNGEAPVAVIVDDVLQVNGRGFDQGLFDLQSIEVLRGPQGALYGRNATQGAIIINTQGPTEELEGYVAGSYGRGDEFRIEGSVAGPIVEDKVLFRLSARYYDFGGIFDNVATGENVGFREELNLRGHLRFQPSENLTIDLRASYTDTEGDALNFTFQGVSTDPVTGEVDGFTGPEAINSNIVQRRFSANNRGFDDRDASQVSLRINYDFEWGTIKSVSAYDSINQATGGDQFPYSANSTVNPGISFFDGTQTQFIDIDAFSQDFRIISPDEQQFRWMFGAYYLTTNRYISSTTGFDLGEGILPVMRAPVLGGTANPTNTFTADDNDNEAYALFFNLAYDITEDLEISFAGRYDEDQRNQTVDAQQGGYNQDGTLGFAIGTAGAENEAQFSRFQPKISARYMIEEDISVYASWGQGFRSGQFNQNGTGAAAALLGLNGVQDVLQQENTDTFEIGFKGAFLDGRLKTAAAIYHTDIENAPFFLFVGGLGAQVLVGIDEVEVIGGEFEAAFELAEGLDGYFSVAVSDSEVKAYSLTPADVGNKAPYTPDVTFNAGLQYRTDITDELGLFLRADYEHRGEQFWDPANLTGRDPVDLVHLRGGLEDPDGEWSVMGSVNNLFDEEYNSEYVSGGFAHAAPPRIWRVDVRFNF